MLKLFSGNEGNGIYGRLWYPVFGFPILLILSLQGDFVNKVIDMVDVVTEILINRSKKEVAEYAAEPDNAPSWYTNIKSVTWKTPKPLTVHSQIAFEANFVGRRMSYVYEVKEWIPNDKLIMATSEGPFPMETIYQWESINQNVTRMTLRNRGNPTGFSKMFAPFMKLAMQSANRKDLQRLKTLLESSFK